jgi:hypothetical protein
VFESTKIRNSSFGNTIMNTEVRKDSGIVFESTKIRNSSFENIIMNPEVRKRFWYCV